MSIKARVHELTMAEVVTLEKRVADRMLARKAELASNIEALAAAGEKVDDLFKAGTSAKPTASKSAPLRKATKPATRHFQRYRNPENPKETWAGVGVRPAWLQAKLEAGAKLEDFLPAKPGPKKAQVDKQAAA